jgi:hypothetical protein
MFRGHTAAALTGVAVLTLLGLNGCVAQTPKPMPSPTLTTLSTKGAYSLGIGDCFDARQLGKRTFKHLIQNCTDLHIDQVFDRYDLEGVDFPGESAVQDSASKHCQDAFGPFIGLPYLESALQYSYLYPSADTWAKGDREIICFVFDPDGKTRGSLKASGR